MISSEAKALEIEPSQKQKLPRRDWIVLPSLGVLTVFLLAGVVELTARHIYPSLNTVAEDCMVLTDPTTGPRGIPNSVCIEKRPEGEVTEYRFNSCGYDTGMECGPKPPGEYRIVMLGTSFGMGMRVPREKTFAALLPAELSRRTQKTIAIYNESMTYRYPDTDGLHFSEILDAHPDMILWALNPGDFKRQAQIVPRNRELNRSFPVRFWHEIQATLAAQSLSEATQFFSRHARTVVLLINLLYSDQNQFLKSSLLEPDAEIGYLRSTPSAGWEKRLADFDEAFASVEAQAKNAGVPVVVVLIPSHVQADMISMGGAPTGYDPYELGDQLQSIVNGHGGTYVDILHDFRKEPNLHRGYFALDGHPNDLGHKVITEVLAEDLSNGSVPELTAVQKPQAPAAEGTR